MPDNQDPIHFFWTRFSQVNPDGRRIIRLKDRTEAELLYQSGFVDTDQFSLDEWTAAFKDAVQPDGSYLLSEQQWVNKKKYIYAGPVDDPLDPLQIREGEWTREEFEKLISEKIIPALLASSEEVKKQADPIWAKVPSGCRPIVDKDFKLALKKLLETCPSPRRLRELTYAAMKSGAQNARAQTSFSSDPSTTKAALDKLSRLLSKGK